MIQNHIFSEIQNLKKKRFKMFLGQVKGGGGGGGGGGQKKKEKREKSPNSYIWFSLCIQTYRRMIKYLYFICDS